MAPMSTEDKIDYIYNRLRRDDKRERTKDIIKWVFRLSIVVFIIYFYAIGFQKLRTEMIQSIRPDISWVSSQSLFDQAVKILNWDK